jgi:iron complex outermembrane receptor protein
VSQRHDPTNAAGPCAVALALAAVLLGSTAVPAPAQEEAAPDTATATLAGQVVSAMTGGPLANARVVLRNSGRGAVTDSAGEFLIRDAPAGSDTVRVTLIGFAEEEVPLTLKADRTTRVTLLLSETVLKVEDITVEVDQPARSTKLEGFDKRRKTGHGHYIGPEEIEQRNAQRSSDYLRGVPGVSVGASRLGRAEIRVTRNPVGQNCDPVVWLDGVPYPDYHIDQLNRDDIMAMEIYRGPSETPPQFDFQGEGCGTIVVWTQDGIDRRGGR